MMRVIMLTGGMRPSPLRAGVGRPIVSLPLRQGLTLFGAWLHVLRSIGQSVDLIVATNLDEDVPLLREQLKSEAVGCPWIRSVRVARDPNEWRGSAGVLRDLAGETVGDGECVLMLEGGCLPPVSLEPIVASLEAGAIMAVGATDDLTPAGAIGCRVDVLSIVPDVGYCDLKEQVIPRLTRRGADVRAIRVSDELVRLRDLDSYLYAVTRIGSDSETDSSDQPWRGLGVCLVEDGATVDAGAILKQSVVLRGASIGAAAILNGCVAAAGASVGPGERVVDRIITAQKPQLARRERSTPRAALAREGALT